MEQGESQAEGPAIRPEESPKNGPKALLTHVRGVMEFAFSREQLMFKKEVINFAKKEIAPNTQEHDLKGEFDLESFRKMADFGILGLHFPEEYGGSGADVVTTALAGEALAEGGADSGFLLAYGAHTFLCGDTLFRNAAEEQRKKYIPKICSGEMVGCMGVTEPDAGSDMASMKTTAEKVGGKYVLNGSKMFITNGPIADVAVVYAKTDPTAGRAGVSAFIVEKGTPGFTAGPPLKKNGRAHLPYLGADFFQLRNPCGKSPGQGRGRL